MVLLLAFFLVSTLLSRRGTARNERQVIANGGVAALAALMGNWTWFAGAGLVAGLSYLLGHRSGVAIVVAGIVGMLVDSMLGATVQGKVRWMDNDAVNLAATLSGAACAALIA